MSWWICVSVLFTHLSLKPKVLKFLGAFGKLLKATVSFVMPGSTSLCPHGTNDLLVEEFSWNYKFENFRNSEEEIQVSLKSGKSNGYFIWKPIHFLNHTSLSSSYNEKYFAHGLQRKKNYIQYTYFFNLVIYELMCKWQVNMSHEICVLDDAG
jgi:hypothetical protein